MKILFLIMSVQFALMNTADAKPSMKANKSTKQHVSTTAAGELQKVTKCSKGNMLLQDNGWLTDGTNMVDYHKVMSDPGQRDMSTEQFWAYKNSSLVTVCREGSKLFYAVVTGKAAK
jgi:hypothetical protein